MIKKISLVLLLLLCLCPLGVFASEVIQPPPGVESLPGPDIAPKGEADILTESPMPEVSSLPYVSPVPEATPKVELVDAYMDTVRTTNELCAVLVIVCCVALGAILALGFSLCYFT